MKLDFFLQLNLPYFTYYGLCLSVIPYLHLQQKWMKTLFYLFLCKNNQSECLLKLLKMTLQQKTILCIFVLFLSKYIFIVNEISLFQLKTFKFRITLLFEIG